MRSGILCLLFVSGCSFLWGPEPAPAMFEYGLTWTCQSPEGCEHTDELRRIDRATITNYSHVRFTSTYYETYEMEAEIASGPSLPPGCSWMYFLTFFGHELERSKNCEVPGGFELEIAIPNEDPGTSSMWLIEGLDVGLL
jgi:hypothetical protein